MVGAASVLGGVSRMTVPQFPADIGKEGVFQLRLVRGPSLWWSSCWNLLEAFDGSLAVFQQSLDEGYRIKMDKG